MPPGYSSIFKVFDCLCVYESTNKILCVLRKLSLDWTMDYLTFSINKTDRLESPHCHQLTVCVFMNQQTKFYVFYAN